ncbi:MAG TPA: hypothetical protein VEB19_18540 [Gemmatimonadaceae bacterium]|nr:hypothetical protein [Gemmatimonadaceae bacterium]
MLKPFLVVAFTFSALSTAAAQHEHAPAKVEKDKPSASAGHSNEHMSGWKELDAYHMVMMRVWHPAKEKNDLAPVRAQAAKLAGAADAWAAAAIPSACDTPENRTNIAKVKADSRALASLVATGTDADVKPSLAALHERFELVNRGCKVSHH